VGCDEGMIATGRGRATRLTRARLSKTLRGSEAVIELYGPSLIYGLSGEFTTRVDTVLRGVVRPVAVATGVADRACGSRRECSEPGGDIRSGGLLDQGVIGLNQMPGSLGSEVRRF
jgi:hypothetical protein